MIKAFFRSIVFCCLISLVSFSFAQNRAQVAPVNPKFVDYKKNVSLDKIKTLTKDWHALGYRPSPLDLSYTRGMQYSTENRMATQSLPVSYDLRTTGRLTAIRDQGQCGSCWAFASYGSLESCLLPAETCDFSENNLKNTCGYDWGPCDGGMLAMSVAYLVRWSGPMLESDDPYDVNSNVSPSGLKPCKHIPKVIEIPLRSNSTDNTTIKNMVMNYGAVYSTMYFDDPYYNSSNKAYYFGISAATTADHSICIVGWDDNFSSTKFNSPRPKGNGAFIIRNSWGSDWGDGGYFYLSYYDVVLGYDENGVFAFTTTTTDYNNIYQQDKFGWVSNSGYGGKNTTFWAANNYTSSSVTEYLKAVGTYASVINTGYIVQIRTGVSGAPSTGTLVYTQAGNLPDMGYSTIALNTSVKLNPNTSFSVVIKYFTPGYGYPAPCEYAEADYDSLASSSPGVSYYSSNGSSWTDAYTDDSTEKFCIKAYSQISGTAVSLNVTNFKANPSYGGVNLYWSNPTRADYSGTLIVSRTDRYPTEPTDGTLTYWYNGTACNVVGTNGQKLYFGIFAHDTALNFAPGVFVSAIPNSYENVQNVTESTPWSGAASVAWSNPTATQSYDATILIRRQDRWPVDPADGYESNLGRWFVYWYNGNQTGELVNINSTYYYGLYSNDTNMNFGPGVLFAHKENAVIGNIQNLIAKPGAKSAILSWQNPTTANYSLTLVVRNSDHIPASPTDGTTTMWSNNTTFTDTSLTEGKKYYYTLFANTSTLVYAPGVSVAVIPGSYKNIEGLNAVARTGSVTLSWTNPTRSDYQSTLVIRRTDRMPLDPTDGTTTIYSNTGTGVTDSGLTNGQTYYYAIYAQDKNGGYSPGTGIAVIPTASLSSIQSSSSGE